MCIIADTAVINIPAEAVRLKLNYLSNTTSRPTIDTLVTEMVCNRLSELFFALQVSSIN